MFNCHGAMSLYFLVQSCSCNVMYANGEKGGKSQLVGTLVDLIKEKEKDHGF